MELRIGIDASINATGIVIMGKSGEKIMFNDYYLLVPSFGDKKPPKCSSSATLITYDRVWETKESTYSEQDIFKILSATNQAKTIVELISQQLEKVSRDTKISCRIEGSLMSSSFKSGMSRLNDLIAFGSVMRYELIKSGLIHEFKIIPPKTLKKLATGNGNAKKGDMILKHQEVFADQMFDYSGKHDDIIDAFWLAYVEEVKNKIDMLEIL